MSQRGASEVELKLYRRRITEKFVLAGSLPISRTRDRDGTNLLQVILGRHGVTQLLEADDKVVYWRCDVELYDTRGCKHEVALVGEKVADRQKAWRFVRLRAWMEASDIRAGSVVDFVKTANGRIVFEVQQTEHSGAGAAAAGRPRGATAQLGRFCPSELQERVTISKKMYNNSCLVFPSRCNLVDRVLSRLEPDCKYDIQLLDETPGQHGGLYDCQLWQDADGGAASWRLVSFGPVARHHELQPGDVIVVALRPGENTLAMEVSKRQLEPCSGAQDKALDGGNDDDESMVTEDVGDSDGRAGGDGHRKGRLGKDSSDDSDDNTEDGEESGGGGGGSSSSDDSDDDDEGDEDRAGSGRAAAAAAASVGHGPGGAASAPPWRDAAAVAKRPRERAQSYHGRGGAALGGAGGSSDRQERKRLKSESVAELERLGFSRKNSKFFNRSEHTTLALSTTMCRADGVFAAHCGVEGTKTCVQLRMEGTSWQVTLSSARKSRTVCRMTGFGKVFRDVGLRQDDLITFTATPGCDRTYDVEIWRRREGAGGATEGRQGLRRLTRADWALDNKSRADTAGGNDSGEEDLTLAVRKARVRSELQGAVGGPAHRGGSDGHACGNRQGPAGPRGGDGAPRQAHTGAAAQPAAVVAEPPPPSRSEGQPAAVPRPPLATAAVLSLAKVKSDPGVVEDRVAVGPMTAAGGAGNGSMGGAHRGAATASSDRDRSSGWRRMDYTSGNAAASYGVRDRAVAGTSQPAPVVVPATAGPSSVAKPKAADDKPPVMPASYITKPHGYVPPEVGLPPRQPGELRICGLTFHPELRETVERIAAEFRDSLGGQPLARTDPRQQQIVPDPASTDAFGRHKLSRNLIAFALAQILKLMGEGGRSDNDLPESLPPWKGVERCADAVRGGFGLRAAQDLKRNVVLGLVGGYVLPAAGRVELLDYNACDPLVREELRRRVGAADLTAWQYLTDAFMMPYTWPSVVEGGHQGAGGSSASGAPPPPPAMLCMLGYGNEAALINDPRVRTRAREEGNNDVDSEEAAGQANCVVLPIAVRGLVLPVVVTLRPISKGEHLFRDYGSAWWRQLDDSWELLEAEELTPEQVLWEAGVLDSALAEAQLQGHSDQAVQNDHSEAQPSGPPAFTAEPATVPPTADACATATDGIAPSANSTGGAVAAPMPSAASPQLPQAVPVVSSPDGTGNGMAAAAIGGSGAAVAAAAPPPQPSRSFPSRWGPSAAAAVAEAAAEAPAGSISHEGGTSHGAETKRRKAAERLDRERRDETRSRDRQRADDRDRDRQRGDDRDRDRQRADDRDRDRQRGDDRDRRPDRGPLRDRDRDWDWDGLQHQDPQWDQDWDYRGPQRDRDQDRDWDRGRDRDWRYHGGFEHGADRGRHSWGRSPDRDAHLDRHWHRARSPERGGSQGRQYWQDGRQPDGGYGRRSPPGLDWGHGGRRPGPTPVPVPLEEWPGSGLERYPPQPRHRDADLGRRGRHVMAFIPGAAEASGGAAAEADPPGPGQLQDSCGSGFRDEDAVWAVLDSRGSRTGASAEMMHRQPQGQAGGKHPAAPTGPQMAMPALASHTAAAMPRLTSAPAAPAASTLPPAAAAGAAVSTTPHAAVGASTASQGGSGQPCRAPVQASTALCGGGTVDGAGATAAAAAAKPEPGQQPVGHQDQARPYINGKRAQRRSRWDAGLGSAAQGRPGGPQAEGTGVLGADSDRGITAAATATIAVAVSASARADACPHPSPVQSSWPTEMTWRALVPYAQEDSGTFDLRGHAARVCE